MSARQVKSEELWMVLHSHIFQTCSDCTFDNFGIGSHFACNTSLKVRLDTAQAPNPNLHMTQNKKVHTQSRRMDPIASAMEFLVLRTTGPHIRSPHTPCLLTLGPHTTGPHIAYLLMRSLMVFLDSQSRMDADRTLLVRLALVSQDRA